MKKKVSIFLNKISIYLDKISIYLDKISIYLDKISITYKYLEKSRFVSKVSKVSISLDDLDKYLNTAKSRLKSLDFKNLDRDKLKLDLDRRENLDGFQKLVSTLRTISISISICLDVETTRLNNMIKLESDYLIIWLSNFKRTKKKVTKS